MSELARYIDHTLLKPEATKAQIEQLCAEAAEHQFASVCVNGSRVELAYSLLEDSNVQVCTVVGFPLGAMDADAKRYETEAAVDAGVARPGDGGHHALGSRTANWIASCEKSAMWWKLLMIAS